MKVKSNSEIRALCEEIALPLGLSIFDVEFKQGKNPALTIYIDREGGVDLDACEKFHNAIFEPLDQLDPTFGQPYTLNVSSPGVDRPFIKDEDYLSHIGKMVEVKLYSSVAGKKFFEGILMTFGENDLSIKLKNGKTQSFARKNIVKVNQYVDF